MSNQTNWPLSVSEMHEKFGVYDVVDKLPPEKLKELLKFRLECIQEEIDELKSAIDLNDPEGAVDALIDNCVFAIGTLDLFGVRSHDAWNAVQAANMNKTPGVKVSTDGSPVRSNPFGFPDLIKPNGWTPPTHTGNHGLFAKALA